MDINVNFAADVVIALAVLFALIVALIAAALIALRYNQTDCAIETIKSNERINRAYIRAQIGNAFQPDINDRFTN
jgi:hypothetical protein